MIKVNFHTIALKDIEGHDVQADFAQELGQQLYMQGQNMEEVELGRTVYKSPKDKPIELTVEQAAIISKWVDRWPYVSRQAVKDALNAEQVNP
jgi:hypothetical protein